LVGALLLLHSPLALVLLSVYVGITAGAYYFGVDSYMMAVVPLGFMGTATALVNGFQTLGGALGSSIAGPVADSLGFSGVGLGTMGLGVLVLIGCGLLLPNRGRVSGGVATTRLTVGYSGVLRRSPVRLLALLRVLPTAYYGTITLLMPLLIYRVAGVPSAAAYYGTVSLLFSSISQFAAGRICDRFGRGVIVVGCMSLMVLTALATPFFSHSLVGLYVCGTLGAGMAWALTVAVPGLICDISPLEERPRTLALIHVSWYAGMVGGTQLAGWLVQFSTALPFQVTFGLNLLALAAAASLVRSLRQIRRS
jgi:MFS family permease